MLTSLALVAGVGGEAAAAVRPTLGAEGEKRRPKPTKTRPVDGRTVKARAAKPQGESGTPAGARRVRPTWPVAGQQTVDLSSVNPKAPTWVRAGVLPVWLTAASPRRGARTAAPMPAEVKVKVADRRSTERAGADGVVLTLNSAASGRVKVAVNYGGFRTAHGGDWAARLRLVRLPACALTTPEQRACTRGTPIPTVNDTRTHTLSADVDVVAGDSPTTRSGQAAPMVLAAEAGPSSPGGDWSATNLTPASTWTAGSNTGEFSWSYPMRVPPVPGDLLPEVTLSYNSGAVDGKTAADNSQASWIGDGFDYWPGFIERKYTACLDEGHISGDLCWGRHNAVLSLNGRATELFYDTQADRWRMKNDDGSVIERLTGAHNGDKDGEHWRITTPDGVRYIFGKNRPDDWSEGKPETNSAWTVPVFGNDSGEPCHEAAFKDSWCDQAWRWNLDHVIDPHRNTITYYYAKETNHYTRVEQTSGGTSYTSGGHLKRIDYGQRQGSTYADPATARIRFDVADRTDFPDDRLCGADDDCGYGKASPTFFERKRLVKVTTELLTDKAAGAYSPVDEWALGQTYQNGVLWLNTIEQTGKFGDTVTAPKIVLTGQLMTNRVVSDKGGSGVHALPAYYRPRLVGINSGTGSTTSISYSDPYPADGTPDPAECRYVADAMPDPKANTKRCFPAKWRDPGGDVIDDWYHKYVVTSVGELDNTGMSRGQLTSYHYLGGAAWRYTEDDGLTKDKWRNWSQWRGYGKVRTITGTGSDGEEQSRTETTYARGMDGNYQGKGNPAANVTVTDSRNLLGGISDAEPLAGSVIETRTFNGGFTDAAEVSATVTKPRWVQTATRTLTDEITGDDLTVRGGWVRPEWAKNRSRKADGTDHTTETYYDYDALGRTVAVDDEGDPATTIDDTCSRTVYPSGPVPAGVVPIQNLSIRVLKVAVDCGNEASHEPNLAAADMISDVKTIYDAGEYGDHPTIGNDRQIETVAGVSGGRSTVVRSVTNSHDAYGRITSTTQVGDPATTADDRTTTTAYTDAAEGWLKSSRVTRPPISVGGKPPAGFATVTEYNPARGTPTKVTDHNGRTADAVYDGLGRIVKAWLPNNTRAGNPDRPSTLYTYAFPDNGDPVSITTKTLRKTSPLTYDTSVEILDGLLRPRQTQTEAPGGGRLVSDTKYDSRGLVFKANAPYLMTGDPSGVLTSADDNQVPSQTITDYDGLGRPTTTTLYSKSTRKWSTTIRYAGEQTITIPPSGAMPSMSVTDARGRVVEKRQYKTTDLAGAYVASTIEYDGAGRPTALKDPAGNVWRTTYDVQGRPETTTDPDKGLTSVTYDHFDQVKTIKDARGTVLTHEYDVLGRKKAVKNGSTLLTEYAYDTLPYALGLPVSATRYVGANKYVTAVKGYDGLYRPTGSVITIPSSEGALGGTYTTSQNYNFDGTPATSSYPAVPASGGTGGLPAEDVTTEYDADGLPEWSHGLSTYVADTIYNAHGDVTQLSLASVSDRFVWQTFDRDEATGRLTRATVQRQSAGTFYDVEAKYHYTDSGSITGIDTKVGNQAVDRQCFTYDYAQRLKEAWTTTAATCSGTTPTTSTVGGPNPYWTSYEYGADGNHGEKAGNRTKEIQRSFTGGPTTDKVRSYSYPAELGAGTGVFGPHALKSVTETQGTSTRTDLYTYDQAGNTTSRPGQKLYWDAEGNLSKVTDTAGKELASFVYDASGNRLIRKDTAGKTLYLPGQELKVAVSGAVSAVRYYSHGGQTIAYRTGTSSSSVQFLMPDYQGTTNTTVNAVDQNTWSVRRFGPFGTPRANATGTWPTVMDKGYVGGTRDATTGLTHLGAREYDPGIGRFLSADPVFGGGDPDTWNGYSYSGFNPIDFADPSGLCRDVNPALGPISCHHPGSDGKKDGGAFGGGGANGTSPTYTYTPPPAPVKPPCTSWTCKFTKAGGAVGKFVSKHRATIAAVAVGTGCGVAIGWTGAGGAACPAAAGAVYGVVSHAQNTPRDQWNAGGFLRSAASGAVVGVLTHGAAGLAAKAAAPLIRRVAPRISSKITGGGGKGGSPGKGNPIAKRPAAPARPTTCKNSFVPGTAVIMADGTRRPIQEVRVGDKVLATDPATGTTRPQTVLATFSDAGSKNLVQVTIDTDGERGAKTGTVIATDNHPFWSPATRQWTPAGRLKPGMWLRTSAGAQVQVVAASSNTYHQRVHNLTIDTDHTYYVAAGGTSALVHNCPTGRKLYRGVAKEHPAYDDASQGIARPRGGNATPEEHNRGNTESIWTSWTTVRRVAEKHATKGESNEGIVLEVELPLSGHRLYDQALMGTDFFGESEILVDGVVENAVVTYIGGVAG